MIWPMTKDFCWKSTFPSFKAATDLYELGWKTDEVPLNINLAKNRPRRSTFKNVLCKGWEKLSLQTARPDFVIRYHLSYFWGDFKSGHTAGDSSPCNARLNWTFGRCLWVDLWAKSHQQIHLLNIPWRSGLKVLTAWLSSWGQTVWPDWVTYESH